MGFWLRERWGETLCLVLLGATGIALLMGAASLPEPMFDPLGPAGMPQYIGYLLLAMLVARVILLWKEGVASSGKDVETKVHGAKKSNFLGAGERGIPRADEVDRPQIVRLFFVVLITVSYIAALTIGGFPFTWLTLLFLAILGAAMSDLTPRKLFTVAAIAVVMSFALTYIFTDILSVVLPD